MIRRLKQTKNDSGWIPVAERANFSDYVKEGFASPRRLFFFKLFNFDCGGEKSSEKCHCAKVSRVNGRRQEQ